MTRKQPGRLALASASGLLALAFGPVAAMAQDGQRPTGEPVTDPKTNATVPRPNTSTPPPSTTAEILPPVPASIQSPAPPGTRAVQVPGTGVPGGAGTPAPGLDRRGLPGPATGLPLPDGTPATVGIPGGSTHPAGVGGGQGAAGLQGGAGRTPAAGRIPGVRVIEGTVVDIQRPQGGDGSREKVRLVIDSSRDWIDHVNGPPVDPAGDSGAQAGPVERVINRTIDAAEGRGEDGRQRPAGPVERIAHRIADAIETNDQGPQDGEAARNDGAQVNLTAAPAAAGAAPAPGQIAAQQPQAAAPAAGAGAPLTRRADSEAYAVLAGEAVPAPGGTVVHVDGPVTPTRDPLAGVTPTAVPPGVGVENQQAQDARAAADLRAAAAQSGGQPAAGLPQGASPNQGGEDLGRIEVAVTNRTRVHVHARTRDGVDLFGVETISSPSITPSGTGVTGATINRQASGPMETNFTNIRVGSFVTVRLVEAEGSKEALNINLIEFPLVDPFGGQGGAGEGIGGQPGAAGIGGQPGGSVTGAVAPDGGIPAQDSPRDPSGNPQTRPIGPAEAPVIPNQNVPAGTQPR